MGIKALAQRNHNVTLITNFPVAALESTANVRQIDIEALRVKKAMFGNLFRDAIDRKDSLYDKVSSQIDSFIKLESMNVNIAKAMYSNEEIKQLVKDESFDMVVVSQFFGGAAYPLAWHFNATLATISPSAIMHGAYEMGSSFETEHVPMFLLEMENNMTLFQRLLNFLNFGFLRYCYFEKSRPSVRAIVQTVLPDCPPLIEIERETSLMLSNTHPIFHYPRSLTPGMIDIGTIHCKPASPLPPALEAFVGEHKPGFIMFAVGSAIQMSDMPDDMLNSIIETFARLPQRVIWQWKGDHNITLPDNVMTLGWLPQQDLLGHKNCRLFLTHGGLNSLMESVYHGVPILGLPFGHDQNMNLARAKKDGYGLMLRWKDVSHDTLSNSLTELLNNPKYSETIDRLSALMKDQPQSPLDRAVYWIEFNLRHNGAKHLRLGSRNLSSYQRALVDVYAVIAAVVLLPIVLLVLVVRKCCCSKRTKKAAETQAEKNKKKQ